MAEVAFTCKADEGTENIMASLKMGLLSPRLVDVLFLATFLPFCNRYTLTKQSKTGRKLKVMLSGTCIKLGGRGRQKSYICQNFTGS